MATVEQVSSKTNELVVTPRDILFECPSCSKSLVVDEAAEGMIVDCPQCQISVIVPPKVSKGVGPILANTVLASVAPPVAPPPTPAAPAAPAASAEPGAGDDQRTQIVALVSKMKELQTQRAEINNRMAARINDINRDLVLAARLESAYQQVVAELNQVAGKVGAPSPAPATLPATGAGRTRVNLTS